VRGALLGALALAIAGGAWWLSRPGDSPSPATPPPSVPPADGDRIGPYPRSQFYMDHDRFLAADGPATVAAAEADFLRPDDEVYGVVLGGQARAYPVTMISYHHVVNDVVGDVPVAVFY
jgi:hypothetical protein